MTLVLRKEKAQITVMKEETLQTDATAIKRIIRCNYEKFYANKNNLEETDKFIETCNLSRLNHEEISI